MEIQLEQTMIARLFFLLLISVLALVGCQRSEAEKLAYQHAEQQYRINTEASAKYHRAKAAREKEKLEREDEDDDDESSAKDEKE